MQKLNFTDKHSNEHSGIEIASFSDSNLHLSEVEFAFVISPRTTVGVDIKIFVAIMTAVRGLVKKLEFKCEIVGIVLFPIIMEDRLRRPDFITRKRDGSYFVGKGISYDDWNCANPKKKLKLASENCIKSINEIPEKYLSISSKEKIISMIMSVEKIGS